MGFFDDIGKKMSETKNSIVATSEKIEKENKLKKTISFNETKLQNEYKDIGKKVYENRDNMKEISDFIKEKCDSIENIIKENEDMKKEILTLNNKKLCPNCSAEIALDAMFCPECGKEQEKVEPKPEILPKGKKRCTGCKEIIDDKVSFCPLCGAEQKEEPQDNENKENTKEQIEEKNDEDK